MRVTNSMMMNNSKTNINNSKGLRDQLNTQSATQKKISRPSEDPIIATRSLRLRSNLSEIAQYYEKNIPDAESWLEVTEASMCNMRDIVKDMYYAYTQGANGDLSLTERGAIMENLEALSEEYYKEGNSSYAGRRIFSGYKTDTDFTFKKEDMTASYNIDETFTVKDVTTHTYISNLVSYDRTNPTALNSSDMPQPKEISYYSMTYAGMSEIKKLSYTDAAGNEVNVPVTTVSARGANADNAYLQPAADGVNFVQETGELVFGEDILKQMALLDERTVFTANYDKTGFKENEIRPQMYYHCMDLNTSVEYKKEVQDIEYQVGFNQTIKVNTEGSDVILLDIKKEVTELGNAMAAVGSAEKKVNDLKEMMEKTVYTETQKKAIQTLYDAAVKEHDLYKDKMQKLFEAGVGNFQKYENEINLQITNEGNRSSRLLLVKTRMQQQKTNFSQLLTTNEDRELSDIILDYTAVSNAYQASLQATGKISQLSLLNYL